MAAKGDHPLFEGRREREHRSFQKTLLLNRKEWEEGKGSFQGNLGQAAPGNYRPGPVRQGSFVRRWELSVFLNTRETASSPSAQPHVAFDFLPVTSYLSFCQMIHCRPAEFICTKMFRFWIVSHRLLRRDCLVLNELQES